ncbi:hypothetical protein YASMINEVIRUS_1406 [Yasminevirus sp. GU-2018]|uniref:Uncharacterized protein n=1 Tax=Yasminevirus sp. GU-2018 TaxID=2420051 RepID=A0A5K0UBI1_9VIRU|nr:hypothetical protein YASMINEVIRUS_1406 [Yasminevirus sp. GU-2018]
MNKRWGSDDKIELMRQYASGKSYEEISQVLGRSPNAIKLRLESIVYENLIKGKPVSMLSRMLNTDADTIKQFYYSHKSFRQGRGEDVKDVDFSKEDDTNKREDADSLVNKMLGGSDVSPRSHSVSQSSTHSNDLKHRVVDRKTKSEDSDRRDSKRDSRGGGREGDSQRVSTAKKSLRRVEEENHVLEEIIKNYRMKRQVKKLYVDGKLDKKGVIMYEKLLKRSK